jgi:YD repeat-containing protein
MEKSRFDYIKEFFLSVDGFRYFDEDGSWYKIEIAEAPTTSTHPGGISYSLAYFDAENICRVRFDNAHQVRLKGRGTPLAYDHWHRFSDGELVPYLFVDLPTLFEDFFRAVEARRDAEYRSSG